MSKVVHSFSKKQLEAIPLLAGGMPQRLVADECKCAPSTVNQWMKIPHFVSAVREVQGHKRQEHAIMLAGMRDLALIELYTILADKDTPIMAKLKAGDMIFNRTGFTDGDNVEKYIKDEVDDKLKVSSPHQLVAVLRKIPRHLLLKALSAEDGDE
jgi:hypothetical protein